MAQDKLKATKNADGTWTIHDAPIFATHRDWRDGRVVDESWLRSALARAEARYAQDAYLPPIHVRHHGDEGVTPAGRFQLKRIEPIAYEGKLRPFVLADLTVSEPVLREIESGKIQYASVEIQRPNGPPEIDSLALLDHDPPFFRKTLRVERAGETAPVQAYRVGRSERPALAYRSAASGDAVLYPFRLYGGVAMADEKPTDKPEEKKPEGEKTFMSDELDAVKTATKEALESFKGKLETLCSSVDQMAADLGIDLGAGAAEVETPDAGPVEAPMAAMRSGTRVQDLTVEGAVTDHAKNYATALGRLAAVEAEMAAQKKARGAELLADKTLEELREYGVGSESRPELVKLAREGGEIALKAYASAMKAARLREPPAEWTGELSEAGASRKDTDAVAAYSARGPKALDIARRLNAKHFTARGYHASSAWLAAQDELGPLEGEKDVYGGRLNGAAKGK